MIASYKSLGRRLWIGTSLALAMLVAWNSIAAAQADDAPRLKLEKGDHVVLIGNTLAERLQYFGNWETLLHSRFPELELVVRNLGFSADELAVRPRSADFKDHGATLEGQTADVVIAFFGFNESFGGKDKLPQFERELEAFVTETTGTNYNGQNPPRLALVSPIAHENLHQRGVTDGKANNANLKLYTEAMAKAAAMHKLPFVDLFTPTQKLMESSSSQPLTFNGIHLNESGDAIVSKLLDEGFFGPVTTANPFANFAKLRAEVNEKNQQFFYDHRAVNGYYIYGKRKTPFGVVNFPEEFRMLRKMIDNRDRRVWAVAWGQRVPDTIDDGNTGEMPQIESNKRGIPPIVSPERAKSTFSLPAGYRSHV